MKRVLYIADTLKQRSGVTAVITNYISNIYDDSIAVDVIAYEDSETEIVEKLRNCGSRVYYMPSISLTGIFKFCGFFNNFFSSHKGEYGIVHSHFNQIDAIVFPIAQKYGVSHCISHSHNMKWSEYKLRAIRNWLMCLPQKQVATQWVACSVAAGVFMFGKEFENSSKARVIKNAIDCTRFDFNPDIRISLRSRYALQNKTVIGFVGSLKPQKNVSFLLDVFAELIKCTANRDKYVLIIVGTGPLEEELKQKAKILKLERNVNFMGRRSDVSDLMQMFDILTFPSLYEGLGLALIEAQVSGVKCIASDTIPAEAKITDNVKFLPIDRGPEIWCKEICSTSIANRKSMVPEANGTGYEIKSAARELVSYYKKLML